MGLSVRKYKRAILTITQDIRKWCGDKNKIIDTQPFINVQRNGLKASWHSFTYLLVKGITFDIQQVIRMKILILGNCQVYGCGLTDEEGFVEQFIKKIVRNHFFKVQVTTFVAVSLKESVELLMSLEPQLYTYDLIILQLANDELMMTESFRTILQKDKRHYLALKDQCYHGLKTYGPSDINYFRTALAGKCGMQYVEPTKFTNLFTLSLLKIAYQVGSINRLNDVHRQWKVILQLLMSVRSKVVVVSPLPSLNKQTQLLRVAGNQFVLDTCQEMEFTAIDSLNLLERHPYFFLPDGNHLNVLGHKMLANRLFQLYSKGKMVDRPSFMYQFSDN